MSTQTEAERLADALEHWAKDYATTDFDCEMGEQAAAELRRLVSFNNDLMDEVARLNKAVSDEREACAQVCDSWSLRDSLAAGMAEEIRARGNT